MSEETRSKANEYKSVEDDKVFIAIADEMIYERYGGGWEYWEGWIDILYDIGDYEFRDTWEETW